MRLKKYHIRKLIQEEINKTLLTERYYGCHKKKWWKENGGVGFDCITGGGTWKMGRCGLFKAYGECVDGPPLMVIPGGESANNNNWLWDPDGIVSEWCDDDGPNAWYCAPTAPTGTEAPYLDTGKQPSFSSTSDDDDDDDDDDTTTTLPKKTALKEAKNYINRTILGIKSRINTAIQEQKIRRPNTLTAQGSQNAQAAMKEFNLRTVGDAMNFVQMVINDPNTNPQDADMLTNQLNMIPNISKDEPLIGGRGEQKILWLFIMGGAYLIYKFGWEMMWWD
jgi:hypothetical protein